MISLDDFKNVDIRVGTVVSAEKMPASEKMVKLIIDFGDLGERQILAGIGRQYQPAELLNRQLIAVINLAPRVIMGLKSEGMVLAAKDGDKLVIFEPSAPVSNGVQAA